MPAKLIGLVSAVVIIAVVSSCSLLSSLGKNDFIIGEGSSRVVRDVNLAKSMAAGSSRMAIAEQVGARYFQHREAFIKEYGSSDDRTPVNQFDSILKEISPQRGTFNIKIVDIEKVKEVVEGNADNLNARVSSRMHIGSADKALLERIMKENALFAALKKTRLYKKMIKNIERYEKMK